MFQVYCDSLKYVTISSHCYCNGKVRSVKLKCNLSNLVPVHLLLELRDLSSSLTTEEARKQLTELTTQVNRTTTFNFPIYFHAFFNLRSETLQQKVSQLCYTQ